MKILFFIIINFFVIYSTDYYSKIKGNKAFIKQNFSNNYKNISNSNFFNNITIDVKNNSYIFFNETIYIDIDNRFPIYEDNIDFSNYSTDIKAIAFYSPKIYLINETLSNETNHNFSEWIYIKNARNFFKGHNQPRNPDEKKYLGYYDLSNLDIIKKQVNLAKSHGIYGFAIYYYWSSGKVIFDKPLKLFLENKDINFHFLLVWKNINCSKLFNRTNINIFNNLQYNNTDPTLFIRDIKKYFLDSRYIKINSKYVIGIYDNYDINNLIDTINVWRNKSRELGTGEIYVLINQNNYNSEILKNTQLFDAAYEFFPNNELVDFTLIRTIIRIYTSIIYFNNNLNNINNDFPFFRCSMLEWDNTIKNGNNGIAFDSYSPEQFYYLNKIIIQWTRIIYNTTNRFIFINAWNEWDEGNYLEPDSKYGFSSINALSKSLFNITYRTQNNNLYFLINTSQIAVQAHIYYENLINEVIEKVNNIPVKYDLYITTTCLNKSVLLENYIKLYSNANKYEIKIMENKGRDVIPFLNQIKYVYKNYKYICHIHTKRSLHNPEMSKMWRDYLYDNLLGSKETISEILTDFENNEKLGFIFPEHYFYILSDDNNKREPLNKIHINFLLKKMFPHNKYEAGELLDFPSGDMFWAKISSIYQIFEINIDDKVPDETGQVDCTIMHGIERIWLYLVKINGFYYQKVFKKS